MGMGMSLKHLAVIGAVTFVFWAYGHGSQNWWPLAAWLTVMGLSYLASLYLHPLVNCWRCKGNGRHTGMLWDYARRPCERCAGSGRKIRFGARMLRIDETGHSNQRR